MINKYSLSFLSFRRWASIFVGLSLIVSGVFSFLSVSAETEAVEKPAEQTLALGKLAFSRRNAGPAIPEGAIIISNPDGSGQTGLQIPVLLNPTEPAWSPDAAKLAFVTTQPSSDVYVINADGSGQTNLTNTTGVTERDPSWSPMGKIAYERAPGTVNAQIWVINSDGSGNVQFSGITQPFPSDPAWSPDGTKLAFTSASSNGEIWVINSDGTNERRVATGGFDPAWSPDGTKIVFAKTGNGIAVINADGTNETPLPASGTMPSWSPDGTKIAFRGGSSGGGIYTMDANGANQVRIVADIINFPLCCDQIYENPVWQPVAQTPNTFTISGRVNYNNLPLSGAVVNLSGTVNAAATTDAVGNYQFANLPLGGNYTVSPSFVRYYFTPANRSFNNLSANQSSNFEVGGVCISGNCVKRGRIAFTRNGDILTLNEDGSNMVNITNNSATDGAPNYSPDGSYIAFTTIRDGNDEIYRMNADGSNPVNLTNNSATDYSPYYSPDGASIVFVSDRDGNTEIYKMNADGTNQVRLTNDALQQQVPAFSPDGRKIIYAASSNPVGGSALWTMNADGSGQQILSNVYGFYNRPSYSPDGTKIIFVYGDDVTTQNIWMANADGTNRVGAAFARSSPSYSPDGAKVVHACCFSTGPTQGIYVSTPSGMGPQITMGLSDASPDWQQLLVTRRTPFDFDADGRSDMSVFRPSNSAWYLQRSTDGLWVPQWGLSTDVLTPADYDGDLKTDVAVWRSSEGNFYILNSFNNTVRIENFGLSGDVPTGGDWDGDGKADLAVYRGGAQSVFYYRGSMGNPQGNVTFIPWGTSGDKPVVGDYDGDARTDAAIYRNGTWWIRQSSNGQSSAIGFGLTGDTLVPADYDADGKTDVAVYRGGVWYLLRSAQGFAAFQFGISSDTPAPADYDGDGKADAAIYRNGVWWILKSQTGAAEAIQFGLSDDKPIPSAFVR